VAIFGVLIWRLWGSVGDFFRDNVAACSGCSTLARGVEAA